jgi:hypothetical protein
MMKTDRVGWAKSRITSAAAVAVVECDFAHAVGREDRARVGTAREISSRAQMLEGRAFAHPTNLRW